MDSIEVVRLCPYCEGNPEYAPDALHCSVCETKRPGRSVYIRWDGGSAESRRAEQDALDFAIHGDNFVGWIRSTIAVEGPVRRIRAVELHSIGEADATSERLAREQVVAVLQKLGLTVEHGD